MAFNKTLVGEDVAIFESSLQGEKREKTPENSQNKTLNPPLDDVLPFEKLEKTVYYKNPWIQLSSVCLVGVPLVWGIFSAFDSPKQTKTATAAETNDETLLMQKTIEDLETENRSLEMEKALEKQGQIETIAPQPKPEPSPSLPPKPQPVAQKPPPPQPVIARTTNPPPPQPLPKKAKSPSPEPEIDPTEKWAKLSSGIVHQFCCSY